MKRFVLSLILAAATAVAAFERPCVAAESAVEQAFAGVKFTQDRTVVLPQDGNKFYLTVIGNPNDARFAEIRDWFSADENLVNIRKSTHFNVLTTIDPMYRDRYASSTPATPLVRLQAKNGLNVYEAYGENIPMSSAALTNAINTECFRRWRQRCQPQQEEPAEKAPETDAEPVDAAPAPAPAPEPAGPSPLVLLGLISAAALVGGGAGIVKKMKETYQKVK